MCNLLLMVEELGWLKSNLTIGLRIYSGYGNVLWQLCACRDFIRRITIILLLC